MEAKFPKLRDDLRIADALIVNDKYYIVIRDPLLKGWAHPGYKVSPEVLAIAKCCDGQTPVELLPKRVFDCYGYKIEWEELAVLLQRLDKYCLLDNERSIQAKRDLIVSLAREETRAPVGAGNWYPADPDELRQEIERCFLAANGPGSLPDSPSKPALKGLIVPHASLSVSGNCAAWAYRELGESEFPDLFIILGPNHVYHHKDSIEIMLKDFSTPLGRVRIEREFASKLIKNCKIEIIEKGIAHYCEHSIEMQLPFLQYISRNHPDELCIVPLILSQKVVTRAEQHQYPLVMVNHGFWQAFTETLRQTIIESGKRVCIIASGDFTHYGVHHNYVPFESDVQERIKRLDEGAISLIEKGQAERFLDYATSMTNYCCTLPVYVVLNTIIASEIKLLNYHLHEFNRDCLINTFASLSLR